MHASNNIFLTFLFLCLVIFSLPAISLDTKKMTGEFWVPKNPPKTTYRFDCDIDPDKRTIIGSGTINITNTAQLPIYRLAIDWAINDYQKIDIKSKGKAVEFLGGDNEQTVSPITFELPEPLYPGEDLEMMLSFSIRQNLPLIRDLSVVTGSTVDRLSMRRFLPTLWWEISTHDNYEVKIDVPAGYGIATSGRLNPHTGYYQGEAVRNFGLFIGKNYDYLEGESGGTFIRCYYNEKSEKTAAIILETAVDAINFFKEYFGFYPFKHLNLVPGSVSSWGGYNTATSLASIHSMERFSDRNESHWRTITVHEIGHMYWGEYVMEKDTPGWLWLGLGIYSQREYARFKHPGPNNPHYYLTRFGDAMRQYYDTTIEVPPHYLEKMESYYNSVVLHGKGFSIISTLDCILGQKIFDRIVRRCLKEFGGQRLGAAEFQNICEQESQQDLNWFFDPWLRSNTFPSYQISSQDCQKNKDVYISKVKIDCLGTLKIPVPVKAFFEDGSSQLKFTDRMLINSTLVFKSKSPLKIVLLDPDTLVALVNPPPSGDFDSLVELNQNIQNLPWTGAGEQALSVFREAKQAGLTSPYIWQRLGLLLYDGKYYKEALQAFDYALEFNDNNPYVNYISYTWKGHLCDLLDHREKAIEYYKKALAGFPGGPVQHSQYNMMIDKKWLEERLQEPFRR